MTNNLQAYSLYTSQGIMNKRRFELYYTGGGDRRGAPDCACAHSAPTAQALPLDRNATVQAHTQRQYLELHDDYKVVFVPSISRVAVLNTTTQQLLERFDLPQSVADLDLDEWSIVQQLYQLQIIHVSHHPPGQLLADDELIVWLHVTNACNLRCTYCYLTKTNEMMSAETGLAAIDAVFRSASIHHYSRVRLKYAGGEATLNLALVEQMHRYAQAQAVAAGIELNGVVLSNGVGLTNYKLQRIHDLGLDLMISFDGPEEAHDAQRRTVSGKGSYRATSAAIERAQRIGINLTVSVTVTGANAQQLPVLVEWLLEREIHFTLNFYRENDCSASFTELQLDEQQLITGLQAAYSTIEEHLPKYSLLDTLLDRVSLGFSHQRTCAVGEHYLVIDHNGRVAKCQMEIDKPITNIWQSDPLLSIRLDPIGVQNIPVDQKQDCRNCEWRYWCAGGCAVATFRATGRYDVKSPNCNIYKALYPHLLRLEGLRLLHWGTASKAT